MTREDLTVEEEKKD